MKALQRKVLEIEKSYRGVNLIRLIMKDGSVQRLPVDRAVLAVMNDPGLYASVESSEGLDNGILPDLMNALIASE